MKIARPDLWLFNQALDRCSGASGPVGRQYGESRRLLAPEEPVHTISVGQMPVGSKRHVSQIVQECLVGSYGKLVEDFSELAIRSSAEVDADHVSLFGSSCG